MANVGVTFDFAAESAKLRSEVDKVRKELSGLKASAKSIEDGFKFVGGAIAGALSIGAITAFVSKVNSIGNNLADLSTRLNASASGLQILELAAAQAGGSAEGMDTALAKMSTTLGDAVTGNKAAADAFAKLGVSAKELAGLKADEAFRQISAAIEQIPNSFERASIAQDIFGKGAKDINGLLASATSSIDGATAALAEQGAVLNDLDVSKIDQMNDALGLQQTIVTNLGIKFLSNLSPAVNVAVNSFADLMKNMGGATEAGKTFGVVLTAAIKMIEAAVYSIIAVFESMRYTVAVVMWGIVQGVAKIVETAARAAEILNLSSAASLRSAADNTQMFADSLNVVATTARTNAQSAASAAFQAGAAVLNAGAIFGAEAAKMEAQAAATAARVGGAQGATGGVGTVAGKAGKAAKEPGVSLSEATLYGAVNPDPMLDPRVIAENGVNAALLEIHDQYAQTRAGQIDALNETVIGSLLSSAQFQQQIEANKNATMGDMMGSLVSMAISQGGALGKAGKALAIAQTIWSTGTAVMKAMAEVPFPANIAAAASVAVMGVAQLANIMKTNVGSGGSVVGAKGGTVGGSTPATPDNMPGTYQPTDQYRTTAQIVIQGNVFSSQETADWIINQLREATSTRDVVFINSNSRQALELAGA